MKIEIEFADNGVIIRREGVTEVYRYESGLIDYLLTVFVTGGYSVNTHMEFFDNRWSPLSGAPTVVKEEK
jgi:hypothetical protein